MRSPRTFAVLAAPFVALVACAKAQVSVGAGAGAGAGAAPSGGSTSGSGGAPQITLGTAPTTTYSQSDDASTTQVVGCDGGDGCSCPPLNVAVLGKPGDWGASSGSGPTGTDSDTALQDWLNSSSAGTARVDNFTQRKTLTPDFLATYNVIILASLSDESNNGPWWTYSADEISAFQAWVQNGGGVIALTGYSGGDEQTVTNSLIGFSGIQINHDGVGNCIDWQICNCTHSSTLSDWVRTDPVIANLSSGVTLVGFTNGHSITVPTDGHVAATVTQNGNTLPVMVGKIVGKGRVLVFGDEWITYTSQWTGAGNPSATDPSCKGFLPQDKYQIPQFWYNMIRWSQPSATCFTVIVSTGTPVTIW